MKALRAAQIIGNEISAVAAGSPCMKGLVTMKVIITIGLTIILASVPPMPSLETL
ncbi:hypothetical protein L21SP3_01654 [Sedimentisphaera cyanobacteriorum]|uniref:Uncharacterized protein n=1 Tax=Sedimentisphaera cyanobacteriorum TaxID=1940790 RepID=A0A1Q2HRH8_9BACT|nr:hypothetical protein L21SP3_01654 [Sedimentisphaera cyanobacteriorum]